MNQSNQMRSFVNPDTAITVGEAQIDEITITPDLAQEMLFRRRPSHPVDRKESAKLAESIEKGLWVLNGMPILFSTEGALLDGVKRLTACVIAGKPIRTLIAENIPEDVLHTVDQHRRRSFANVLESRGIRSAGAITRLLQRMIRFQAGDLGIHRTSASWVLLDRALEANPLIKEAVGLCDRIGPGYLGAAARQAVAFMALQVGEKKEIQRFLNVMRRPDAAPSDYPGSVLAQQLEIADATRSVYTLHEQMAMATLAFNDILDGKTRKTYIWKPDYGGARLGPDGFPIDWSEVKQLAPENLGMPWVKGYHGLHGINLGASEEYDGPLVETWRSGAERSDGTDRMNRADIEGVKVTPEMAQDWLNRFNRNNRKIQPLHVATIQRDIEAGDWQFNAQPICFSETGRLLNGQNRLTACVGAGLPIDVIVVRNLPEEAFATYDIQRRKVLSYSEDTISAGDQRVVAAAAKFQWAMDTMGDPIAQIRRPSASEIRSTLKDHPGLMDAYSRSRRFASMASAGVMCFMINYAYEDSPGLADAFLDGLETGAELPVDSPILKLRTTLLTLRGDWRHRKRRSVLTELMAGWETYKQYIEAAERKKEEAERKAARERRKAEKQLGAAARTARTKRTATQAAAGSKATAKTTAKSRSTTSKSAATDAGGASVTAEPDPKPAAKKTKKPAAAKTTKATAASTRSKAGAKSTTASKRSAAPKE